MKIIKMYDIVTMDFAGFTQDGFQFPGGTAKSYQYQIGSKKFIPGFEEAMIGKEYDKEFEINVTFPNNYHEKNLAGKPVVFKVKAISEFSNRFGPITEE